MNGIQFLALLIACAVLYRYAIHDKLMIGNNMTTWPENKNPIITIFRESFDSGDKWSSTVNFLFALCDIAMTYDVEIPEELHFSQSPFGPDTDSYDYIAIEALLYPGTYIHEPLSVEELQKHVSHALKVLGKYDSILRIEGQSY